MRSLALRLVLLAVQLIHAAPLNSDVSDEVNPMVDDQNAYLDDEIALSKRKLPVEGILIGRRAIPSEGILLGRRNYPTEGILLGKRKYLPEGILIGKRNFRY